MKLVIAAATVVALIGISSSNSTAEVQPDAMAAPTPMAVEQSLAPLATPAPVVQRVVAAVPTVHYSAPPPLKPIAAPTARPGAAGGYVWAAAADPTSPESIGSVQMWRVRGAGAVDTIKQVVEEMAKAVRASDDPNVANNCRLIGAVADAITASLPAPAQPVDAKFRQAADSLRFGASNCSTWESGLTTTQTDAFVQDMKDAVNSIKAADELLPAR